jgi:prephenate dehydrogenase
MGWVLCGLAVDDARAGARSRSCSGDTGHLTDWTADPLGARRQAGPKSSALGAASSGHTSRMHVTLLGLGLIGGSIARALAADRDAGARHVVAAWTPGGEGPRRALAAGMIDVAAAGPGAALADADLVVLAAPPLACASLLRRLGDDLRPFLPPGATVTDVASTKAMLERAAGEAGVRYVGGHPMAGRERSGPVAARGDLFIGRPWVVCAGAKADGERVDVVRRLALALGATPVVMDAREHDASVAVVSHAPQVAASLVAARLRQAPDRAVELAGQGLRDVTRIASSDPLLWAQILAANAGPVLDVLRALRSDLEGVISGLESIADEGGHGPAPGARAAVARVVADGNLGRERIPGKHGGQATRYAVVTVVVPDAPGSLARLFADIGDAGVNVEELGLEHAPGRAVGLVEVSVLPTVRERLEAALATAGWKVVA